MFGIIVLTSLLVAANTADSHGKCVGSDPAIVSATSQSVGQEKGVNRYRLSVTVKNLGSAKQASNVLQSVEFIQSGVKVDQKGLQPLKPGQSYTVTHDYLRSVDAGVGTTPFTLRLRIVKPSPPGVADCNPDNNTYELTV
jgi:hypothetical protein